MVRFHSPVDGGSPRGDGAGSPARASGGPTAPHGDRRGDPAPRVTRGGHPCPAHRRRGRRLHEGPARPGGFFGTPPLLDDEGAEPVPAHAAVTGVPREVEHFALGRAPMRRRHRGCLRGSRAVRGYDGRGEAHAGRSGDCGRPGAARAPGSPPPRPSTSPNWTIAGLPGRVPAPSPRPVRDRMSRMGPRLTPRSGCRALLHQIEFFHQIPGRAVST